MPVSYGGVRLDQSTVNLLKQAQKVTGFYIPLTQGSYHPGVGASAGTHDGGGVLDVNVNGMSRQQIVSTVAALRQVGFAAWYRDQSEGFSPHIHAVEINNPNLSGAARSQIPDFYKGLNGLASHARDTIWADAQAGNPHLGQSPSSPSVQNNPLFNGQTVNVTQSPTVSMPSGFNFGQPSATQNVTGQLDTSDLAHNFNWASTFLGSIPELQTKFSQAVQQNWSPSRFQAEIQNTKWWKTNSETMRQIQIKKNTDPATYKAAVDGAKALLHEKAVEVGAVLSDAQLSKMATDSVSTGMNDAQITNMLSGYVKLAKGQTELGGHAGDTQHELEAFAHANGVWLDQATAVARSQAVVKGTLSMEQAQDQIRSQAATLFPAFASEIKAGQNVQDLAQPYIQEMAQTLEMPETAIDLTDPLIKQALNGKDPNGNPHGMSLGDFMTLLKKQPGWGKTTNAREAALAAGNGVLRDMGLMGAQ